MLLTTVCDSGGNQIDPSNGDAERILLDVDVDGCRYLLVRMSQPDCGRANLSPRELEIARMVAAGHLSKTIASVLNISSWTVGTHLRRIYAKLGVKTRAAMVSRLHEIGSVVHARTTATGLHPSDSADPTRGIATRPPSTTAGRRRA